MKNKEKILKIFRICGDVLLYFFIAVCLLGVILTIASKKDKDGTASIFGMQMRLVLTASMEKCEHTDVSNFEIKDIPVNSMIFIEEVPEDEAEANEWYKSLKVGDVLTFKYVYTKQETITHRITSIVPKEDGEGYIITLTGDNKNDSAGALDQVIDTTKRNSPEYIIGKVTGQSLILGLIFTILRSPLGLIFIVIVPSLVIIAFEIVKIVKLVGEDKKKKEEQEKKEQQDELEMLRRKLAELEKAKDSSPTNSKEDEQEASPAEEA